MQPQPQPPGVTGSVPNVPEWNDRNDVPWNEIIFWNWNGTGTTSPVGTGTERLERLKIISFRNDELCTR